MIIEKEYIKNLPCPEWTPTWHPLKHDAIVQKIDHTIEKLGLSIIEEKFEINSIGTNIFATYLLDPIQLGFHDN